MRKIESIRSIKELSLDSKSARTVAVHGYSISVLITAARCNELKKLEGIGQTKAEKIMAAIDEAGFIMHESATSLAIRDLLAAAFYFPLGTVEEYEARVEFTEQQREELFKLFETLTEQEAEVLKLRFGLGDAKPMNLREVANEFNVSRERIRSVEANALRKLRHPTRKRVLQEIFPDWPGFDLATPRRTGGYRGPIEGMPIEELSCLSVRAYNCLTRAGIHNVGQLMKHTYTEVRKIRNMTFRATENIVACLSGVGCKLKAESETDP